MTANGMIIIDDELATEDFETTPPAPPPKASRWRRFLAIFTEQPGSYWSAEIGVMARQPRWIDPPGSWRHQDDDPPA